MSKGTKSFTKGYEKEIQQCIRCGFCQAICPVYDVTYRPAYNARGKMLLLKEVMEGSIQPGEELSDPFYTCTTCQACTYSCPAKIKVDEVVEGVRKSMYEAGFVPQPLLGVRDNISNTGNVYASAQEDRIEIYPPALKEKVQKGELKSKAETLLFMGCVPSYLDMKIVPSLIKPLDAAEVDYTTLAMEESCCGFPLFLMGSDQFESHAVKIIEKIKATGARELVTPCAGCYKTFKKLYPKIGGLELEVYHSVHYIDKLINDGKIKFNREVAKTVTYHDPCDLGRALNIFEEPRNILKNIPGLELVEMSRNRLDARCCGGGGGVQANNPEIAERMGAERVRDALAVDAELIVSGCAACKDNLRKGARTIPRDERGKVKIMDITEIVAKALG
ncbi:MAG: (Fe-S)-binding protein [Deltaproteobacteria bacterium]|nr:(Fe-S)-binding protein [Deltaproteobacteria bacterium]MBW1912587.1 (Fe-S)-binding protein [Deltaproteobacteria bacterium]